MIRPTARLRFELDPEIQNDDLTADLKRSFLNVAPVHIGVRSAIKDPRISRNVLGLVVVLHYPYWGEVDEHAVETWTEILIPWLEKKLFKLNATVQNYNKSRKRAGKDTVSYGQLEIILDNRVFSVQLPSDSSFPDEIPALMSRAREFALSGVLEGEGFLRVEMPWIDVEQLPNTEEVGANGFQAELEKSGLGEEAGGVAAKEGASKPDVDPESDYMAGAMPELDSELESELNRAIDYSIWGIRSQDGSVRKFDSVGGAWL